MNRKDGTIAMEEKGIEEHFFLTTHLIKKEIPINQNKKGIEKGIMIQHWKN